MTSCDEDFFQVTPKFGKTIASKDVEVSIVVWRSSFTGHHLTMAVKLAKTNRFVIDEGEAINQSVTGGFALSDVTNR